jgi:uncharacterized protein
MKRQVIWSNLTATGLEHFQLVSRDDEIIADGIVIGVENDVAFRIRYEIRCDSQWRVRTVTVTTLDEDEQTIRLTADGLGNWTNELGEVVSAFEGCLDVDITATPFTNTLPIRRLSLHPGESSEIKVVYISVPEMEVSVEPQRYTCLEVNDSGGKYRFESLDGDFTAILSVDSDSLVEAYPSLFQRVWSK